MEIIQKLEGLNEIESDTMPTWENIQEKWNEINKVYSKLESEAKQINIASVLRDVLQGAVLLVLVLRTDLRLRGILGLAWNLIFPSFRVRDYIAGHKSSLLAGSGILLTVSLFFSLWDLFPPSCIESMLLLQ